MRHRRALLAGIAACATALAAPGGASGESLTYTSPGSRTVTLPPGVARVHVVAVGGRGGGFLGGYGAVVTADLDLALPSGLSGQLLIDVGGNGGIGLAGANGGGDAPGLPTLAAGGGGWSGLSACRTTVNGACTVYERQMVAGGGGGSGADGLPGTGGAGGSAGAPGGSGSSTALLSAAGGGGAGRASLTAGGSGGVSADPDCDDGDSGEAPTIGGADAAGGAGGISGSLDGHGDGGGGGGSPRAGGAGGGGGAWCIDDTGASGGGGGGAGSTVPAGGQLAIDTTGQPSVTISYQVTPPPPPPDPPLPSATLTAPRDGAVYAQGSVVTVSYGCAPSPLLPGTTIASCLGTLANGDQIDTDRLGDRSFIVEAADSLGHTATAVADYSVTDQTRPEIHGLKLAPGTIDPTARRPFATVAFRLSERSSVLVRVRSDGARSSRARRGRARARAIAGYAGRNAFRLRARIGRRALRAGEYRLTLVAVDGAGNRSRPARARFRVLD